MLCLRSWCYLCCYSGTCKSRCEAHTSPLFVGEIHAADTNRGTEPHQAGPCYQPSFRDRAEVIHLQFHRSEPALAVERMLQRAAYRRIGKAGGDAAVQRSRVVEEFGPNPARIVRPSRCTRTSSKPSR